MIWYVSLLNHCSFWTLRKLASMKRKSSFCWKCIHMQCASPCVSKVLLYNFCLICVNSQIWFYLHKITPLSCALLAIVLRTRALGMRAPKTLSSVSMFKNLTAYRHGSGLLINIIQYISYHFHWNSNIHWILIKVDKM